MSKSKNSSYDDYDRNRMPKPTKHKHQRSGEKQHLRDILSDGCVDEDLLDEYLEYESEQ